MQNSNLQTPELIFQDSSFFVFNKPSGWISNEADTTTNKPVLQTYVKENFDYPLKGNYELRNGIVHRLDKETSGILLVAKTRESFEALQDQFKSRVVNKTYIALVHGWVIESEGVVDAAVGRLPWRRDRFGVLPGGRGAKTLYFVKNRYTSSSGDKFTLLTLKPESGRTHQIRIHLKHIGFPIVSDDFYAGRKTARKDRKWCSRLFLHAEGISFLHPVSNEKLEFKAELAEDLQSVLNQLTICN